MHQIVEAHIVLRGRVETVIFAAAGAGIRVRRTDQTKCRGPIIGVVLDAAKRQQGLLSTKGEGTEVRRPQAHVGGLERLACRATVDTDALGGQGSTIVLGQRFQGIGDIAGLGIEKSLQLENG